METCLSFATVLELIENGHPDARRLEAHLHGGCPSCERKAQDARLLLDLLHHLKAVARTEQAFHDSSTRSSQDILSTLLQTAAAEQKTQQQAKAFFEEHRDDEGLQSLFTHRELIQPATVRALCEMARTYLDSDLGRADAYVGLATSVWEEIRAQGSGTNELIHTVTHADLLLVKGILAKHRDEYEQAIRCFEESAQAYLDAGLEDELASVLIPWAGVLFSLSRLDEAEDYYKKSLGIAQDYGNALLEAKALFGLAIISSNRGRAAEALTLLKKARESFRELGETVLLGATFAIEGYSCRTKAEYQKAIACFEQAARFYEQSRATLEIARVKKNLGNIYHQLGNVRRARACFDEAETIFQNEKNEVLALYVSLDKGQLLAEQGYIEDGRRIALSALEFFRIHNIEVGSQWAEEKLSEIENEIKHRDVLLEIFAALREVLEATISADRLAITLS